jgi:hypothetical protein
LFKRRRRFLPFVFGYHSLLVRVQAGIHPNGSQPLALWNGNILNMFVLKRLYYRGDELVVAKFISGGNGNGIFEAVVNIYKSIYTRGKI